MLISQRIAADCGFLKSALHDEQLERLRAALLQAVKVLVPDHLLSAGELAKAFRWEGSAGGTQMRLYGLRSKVHLYRTYIALPYEVVFIETASVGVLLQMQQGRITYHTVNAQGWLQAVALSFVLDPQDPAEGFSARVSWPGLSQYPEVLALLGEAPRRALLQTAAQGLALTLETLLYFNVPNVTLHRYSASAKENAKVPDEWLPFFEYKVLDVYREVTRYTSLQEICTHLSGEDAPSAQRRAHLVRAHFKERATGLFRWSAFMRNKKNADTAGIVAKDYRLR